MGPVLIQFKVLGLLVLFWSLHVPPSSSSSNSSTSTASPPRLCLPDQRLALVQFKNTFSHNCSSFTSNFQYITWTTFYPKTYSWKDGLDCCLWNGVTCDKFTGHVTGLDLSYSCLIGTIDSNSTLFQLPHLRSLNLAFNDFRDSAISSKFGQFTILTNLNLSSSVFSGLVPSDLSYLSNLVSLDLSQNDGLQFGRHSFERLIQNLTKLSDMILDSVDISFVSIDSFLNASSSLKSISLGDCSLQGNFPEKIFHLPYLEELVLQGNGKTLNGRIPNVFNWSSLLRILDLSNTGFSGYLPSSVGNLKSLDTLDLSYCSFLGSIPIGIRNLTKITSLRLSSNQFTGPIPSLLSNLEFLTELSLGPNNLTGPIPDIFQNFSKLSTLDLSGNLLTGQIPPSVFNLKQLTELTLWYNQLSGPLPDQISGLSTLGQLLLSNNLLNGSIPQWVFALPSLGTLFLDSNQLAGELPEFKSKTLEVIDLSNNKIQGPLPISFFGLVNAWHVELSSNFFSGTLDLDLFSKFKGLLRLDLSNNNLSLEVNNNNNSIWPMLQTLDLSSCNIKSFPSFLSTQNRLQYLSLSRNKISGEIPQWLWLLANSSLYYINLSNNLLTKMKMLSVASNLYYLFVSSNLLRGELSSSICRSPPLMILDLSNNSLGGTIPGCLGNLNSLTVLSLRRNNFTGLVPQIFSKDSSLRNLDVSSNKLEGALPRSLVNCKKLEVLDVGDNKIGDQFPHWLESLPNLQVLVLRSNRFQGPVGAPKSATPFHKLRIIDLSNNAFNGSLPREYFAKLKAMMVVMDGYGPTGDSGEYMGEKYYNDSTTLTLKGQQIELVRILIIFATIDLSNNRFEGRIPEVVGNLKTLKGLNFSHNSLSGHIPSSLANISALESLDLSSNKLTGEIPQQLTTMTFLSVLNLSYNQLEGPIPQGNQFHTFSNDSYIGNSDLCGPPLTKKCDNGDETAPPLTSSSVAEDEPFWEFDWKISMMGYASGLAIGCSIAYMVFMKGEPLWFTKMVDRLTNPHYKKVRRHNRRQRERRRT